jgi:hypothetical protein
MKDTAMRDLAMIFVGSLLTVGVILWTYVPSEDIAKEAYTQGWKAALDVTRPSDDLEFACAGLWFGKDGPIYWKMRKENEQRKNVK